MFQSLLKSALGAGLLLVSINVHAESRPDTSAVDNLPQLNEIQQRGFRYFGNRILSSLYKPFHMIHDVIVTEGGSTTLVGKFDYDAVLHKDLERERVHAYYSGAGMSSWKYVGETLTDRDGKVYFQIETLPSVGEYVVQMVVEGDLSSATGYLNVVKPKRKAVLFDIDGTLTLSDLEGIGEYLGIGKADAYGYAVKMVNAYAKKNYQIIYLTGRPYWVAKGTREWLDKQGFPTGVLHTNPSGDGLLSLDTENYKTAYIKNLIDDAKLEIVRAYGNASTDIAAYRRAGLPVEETYIIGSKAGDSGTNAIYGDYKTHFNSIVKDTPEVDSH